MPAFTCDVSFAFAPVILPISCTFGRYRTEDCPLKHLSQRVFPCLYWNCSQASQPDDATACIKKATISVCFHDPRRHCPRCAMPARRHEARMPFGREQSSSGTCIAMLFVCRAEFKTAARRLKMQNAHLVLHLMRHLTVRASEDWTRFAFWGLLIVNRLKLLTATQSDLFLKSRPSSSSLSSSSIASSCPSRPADLHLESRSYNIMPAPEASPVTDLLS